jgi:hypothetical protein
MKWFIACIGILFAVVAGCQKPDAVIVDPGETFPQLEATPLTGGETKDGISSVDSNGVLPADAANFSAFLLVNNVTYDAGNGIRTDSYAAGYFADHDKPLLYNTRTIGYYGMDLPGITINNLPLIRIPYRVRYADVVRDTAYGFVYLRGLNATYQPMTDYVWQAPSQTTGPGSFSTQIRTPDDVRVISPRGGSILSRDKEILLQWTGKGDMTIVVSVLNPLNGKTRAILSLRPKLNLGRAMIDPHLLQVLPREQHLFVFTFILANRHDRLMVGQFSGKILVQAASVYNSYVQLQ